MTKNQITAFKDLQRIAMDYVRIAYRIDEAIQSIQMDIDILPPEYLRSLVETYRENIKSYKRAFGKSLDEREFEAWNKLLSLKKGS